MAKYIECPNCHKEHKTVAKVRWHCFDCGTIWDASGRMTTGHVRKKPPGNPQNLLPGGVPRKAKKPETDPAIPETAPKGKKEKEKENVPWYRKQIF